MGNVIRSMDRGTAAVDLLVTYLFLYLIPAAFECIAVCVVFLVKYEQLVLCLLAFGGVVLYSAVTVVITRWRKKFREATNKVNTPPSINISLMLNCTHAATTTRPRTASSTTRRSSTSRRSPDRLILNCWYCVADSLSNFMGLLNASQALIINATVCCTVLCTRYQFYVIFFF